MSPRAPGLGLAGVGLLLARAALGGDIEDLSARIGYGFQAEQRAVIAAARTDLANAPANRPEVVYLAALAALREAQLDMRAGRPPRSAIKACEDAAARATAFTGAGAEPWILLAACAGLAARVEPKKAFLHERRFEDALRQARHLDATNPRLVLVELWRVPLDTGSPPDVVAMRIAALEQSRAEFRARATATTIFAARWGETEVLTLLAELYLERGVLRAARDALEQALLLAPHDVRAGLLMQELSARLAASAPAR